MRSLLFSFGFLILLAGLTPESHAQIKWGPSGGPFGGDVTGIEVHPNGTLWSIPSSNTATNRIFKSTDSGSNWTAVAVPVSTLYYDLEIDASGKIYLLSATGLYSSANGTDWVTNATNLFLSARNLKIAPNGALYVRAQESGKFVVLKSIDGGAVYSKVFESTNTISDVITLSNNAVLILVTSEGVYRSTSGNTGTFATSNSGIPSVTGTYPSYEKGFAATGTAVFVFLKALVYMSTDSGASWTAVAVPSISNGATDRIAAASTAFYFYDVTANKLHKSPDGLAWTTVSFTGKPSGISKVLSIKSSTEIFLGTSLGVWRSLNGAEWEEDNQGLESFNFTDMLIDGSKVFVTPSSGLQSTSDGTMWVKNTDTDVQGTNQRIRKLSDGSYMMNSTGCNVYHSTDQGVTWTPRTVMDCASNSQLEAPAANLILTVGSGYSGGNQPVFNKSIDPSGNFTSVINTTGFPTTPSMSVLRMRVSTDGTMAFLHVFSQSVSRNELYKVNLATGAGTAISGFTTSTVIDFDTYDGKVFALVGSTLFISIDAGANWTTKAFPYTATALWTTAHGYLVASNTTGGIFMSRDGGDSWLNSSLGFDETRTVKDAGIDDNGYLYALVVGKGLYKTLEPVVLPEPPTNLIVIGESSLTVRLLWNDNATNESYYLLERSGDNISYDSISVADFSTNQLTVKNHIAAPKIGVAGKTSYFRVAAVNKSGKSGYSNVVTTTSSGDCTVPSAIPGNRSWTSATLNVSGRGVFTRLNTTVTKNSTTLSFFDFTAGSLTATYGRANVSGSMVTNCGNEFMINPASPILPNGSAIFDPATNKLTIPWQMDYTTFPQLANFNEVTEFTLNSVDPIPTALTIVHAFVYDAGSIGVTWFSNGTFEKKYLVERSTNAVTGFAEIAQVDFTDKDNASYYTYIDKDPSLVTNTTYYYRVRSKNDAGVSAAYSPVTNATLKNPFFAAQVTNSGTGFRSQGMLFMDIDGDGAEELLRTSNTNESSYFLKYKSSGLPDRTDTNLPAESVTAGKAADYNNDGILDLLVLRSGPAEGFIPQMELYKGQGGGQFTRVFSKRATSLFAWVDQDNDGKLDILEIRTKINFLGASNAYSSAIIVHKNSGGDTFAESILMNNINFAPQDISLADFDNDGDHDITLSGLSFSIPYVANVKLYQFQAGAYTDVSSSLPLLNNTSYGAGISWGDVDNDGDQDLIIGYSQSPRAIFRNDGALNFTQLTGSLLSEPVSTNSRKPAIGDIDNDGDVDVLMGSTFNQPNFIYKNDGTGSFSKIEGEHFTNNRVITKTAVVLNDFNNDGYLDAFYTAVEQDYVALYNTQSTKGNWIKIKLAGTVSNKSAIGSKLLVTNGTKTQLRELTSTTATAPFGSGGLILHVGVGAATTIDQIQVKWPSGIVQTLTNVAPNQLLVITEEVPVPVISAESAPAFLDKGFTTATFDLTASTVFKTVGSASLWHRKLSAATFTESAGTYNAVSAKWEFPVSESFFDASGMEYYYKAKGAFNTEGRGPAGTATHITNLKYKAIDLKIPSSALGYGGEKANWKVFSIPFELGTNNNVSTVFDDLSTLTNKVDWRLLTYKDAAAWGEYPSDFSTLARGLGYFINIRTETVITLGDNLIAPANSQSDLFEQTLKKGWNQVGNPYLTPIAWPDVAAFNKLSGAVATLKKFANGNYANATDLQPFEGGFVFADTETPIKISFPGQVQGGRLAQPSSDLAQPDWVVSLRVHQQNLSTDFSGIGMNTLAASGMDNFDNVNPPHFMDYIEINFPHPEHFIKNFAIDVVPTQTDYTWDFTVNSTRGETAELSWNNSAFGDNTKQLILFDIALQTPVDMRSIDRYTFSPAVSGKFRIYYGENLNDKINPDLAFLGQPYPNPFLDRTYIPFTLPGHDQHYAVRLEVYDMMGRKVATLVEDTLTSGFYTGEWNSSHEPMSNGVYTIRLAVNDRSSPGMNKRVVVGR